MKTNQTDASEPMTAAEHVIVARLCQWENQFPGPMAWMCRLAWVTLSAGQPFDADAMIAAHADWLNVEANAEHRKNLVGCIDFIRKAAVKPSFWQLPDNPFDPSDWFTPEAQP